MESRRWWGLVRHPRVFSSPADARQTGISAFTVTPEKVRERFEAGDASIRRGHIGDRRQSTMVIAAWVIPLLAILLAPILLIRFRKRWVAAFNLAVTKRITSRYSPPDCPASASLRT